MQQRSQSDPSKRQRLPPWRRIGAIAYAGIRVRLGRSLITMAGICLALAYLVSLRVGNLITDQIAKLTQAVKCYDQTGRFLGVESAYGATLNVTEEQVARWREFLRARVAAELPEARAEAATTRRPPAPVPLQTVGGEWRRGASFADGIERRSRVLAEAVEKALHEAGLSTDLARTDTLTRQRAALWWITGIVLIVTVAGIMNAMLMSVTERFREIGTMKCLGAMDRLILIVFLLESLALGVVGTAIGLAGGFLLAAWQLWQQYGWAAAADIPWQAIWIEMAKYFAGGVILTVIGAVGPAWRAARMAPVEAMRVDQ